MSWQRSRVSVLALNPGLCWNKMCFNTTSQSDQQSAHRCGLQQAAFKLFTGHILWENKRMCIQIDSLYQQKYYYGWISLLVNRKISTPHMQVYTRVILSGIFYSRSVNPLENEAQHTHTIHIFAVLPLVTSYWSFKAFIVLFVSDVHTKLTSLILECLQVRVKRAFL